MDELQHFENVTPWESGGGTAIDLVRLKDGTILAISAESIVLYASQDDLEAGDNADRPVILRPITVA
jgi:hypothetical protein